MPQIYIPKDLYDRCVQQEMDLAFEVHEALTIRLALIDKSLRPTADAKGKQR